ncbi:TonB-dependent receptor [Chitinophaga jiangningensis]|uniref:TonB-dependent receptor n=1 Tax=Chitinophaga jiangningensis TaxID=1419482 RepID=A0A1M6X0Y6_9BACT|nr:TonB-dependent receptor [Chitinophaga jiangningensis]SHK99519.1 TonB-dependent receptor [Chitinophaga jiangningensis]
MQRIYSVPFFTLIVICLLSLSALATGPGKVTGKVTDKKTGEAIPGVTIIVQGTSQGTVTDVEGRYALAVTSGTYTIDFKYMGYQTKSISEVKVNDNHAASLDVILEVAASKDLKEVVIKGSYKQETINALYAAQKNNAVVSDGISADLIRKSPDKNTGEVLKRVSGTSIQDNKFVVVRGLSERYNTTLMNNAVMPSTEPDKKAFSFDIIPSNLIDNITIFKTASPDLPADFAGGAVKVSTKDFPDQAFLDLQLSTGYNTQTTFKDFYTTPPKGKTDWLGFDDGSRKLPDAYKNAAKGNYSLLPDADKIAIAKQFPNSYSSGDLQGKSRPPFGVQLANGNSWHTKGNNRFGYIFSLNYSNSLRRIYRERSEQNVTEHLFDYKDYSYTQANNLGAVLNLAYNFGNNKIAFKNFFNNDFNNIFTNRAGLQYDNNAGQPRISYNAEMTQNSLYNSTVEGTHVLGNRKWNVDWNIAYGRAARNQPDQRILSFKQYAGDNFYTLTLSNENNPNIREAGRVYTKLTENIYSANLNIALPFELFGQSQKFKFGGTKVYRSRDFSAVALGYASAVSNTNIALDKGLTVDQIFTNENIDRYKILLAKIDLNNKDYKGTGDLTGGYLMLDNKLADALRLVWGARVESYTQELTTAGEPKQHYSNVDVLPSLNATYALNEQSNLRFSYSQTVNRPEFRELAMFRYYDFDNEYLIEGNKNLQRALANNLDLRWEMFPGAGEILSASVFYKHFKNPIEQTNDGNSILSYNNAPSATDIGAELEFRKRLNFISSSSIFDNLVFYANAAYINSNVDLPAGSDGKKTPLQGQSPYLINGGLTYAPADNDFSLNLLYNRIGQRLRFRGTADGLDTYERPRDIIDFQISKKVFHKAGEFRLNISDILAQPIAWYYKFPGSDKTAYQAGHDYIVNSVKPGTTFTLSFRYNFLSKK